MGTDLAAALAVLLVASRGGGLAGDQIPDEDLEALIEALYSSRAARVRLSILRMFCGAGQIRIEASRAFSDDEYVSNYDVKMVLSAEGLPTVTLSLQHGSSIPKGTIFNTLAQQWADHFEPSLRGEPLTAIYRLLALCRRYITVHSRDFRFAHHMLDVIEFSAQAPAATKREGMLEGLLTMQPGDGAFTFTILDSASGRTITCEIGENEVPLAVDLAGRNVCVLGTIEMANGGPTAVFVKRIRSAELSGRLVEENAPPPAAAEPVVEQLSSDAAAADPAPTAVAVPMDAAAIEQATQDLQQAVEAPVLDEGEAFAVLDGDAEAAADAPVEGFLEEPVLEAQQPEYVEELTLVEDGGHYSNDTAYAPVDGAEPQPLAAQDAGGLAVVE